MNAIRSNEGWGLRYAQEQSGWFKRSRHSSLLDFEYPRNRTSLRMTKQNVHNNCCLFGPANMADAFTLCIREVLDDVLSKVHLSWDFNPLHERNLKKTCLLFYWYELYLNKICNHLFLPKIELCFCLWYP